jgi:hypothetical protein
MILLHAGSSGDAGLGVQIVYASDLLGKIKDRGK